MSQTLEIISHRGAKGLAPENSLEAIKQAMLLAVDMIEIDVRLHNGAIVISHDETMPASSYLLLADALSFLKGQVPLNIEVKEQQVVSRLPKLLDEYTGKIVFSSFKFVILSEIKKLFPDHELAVLEKWSGVRAVAEAELLGTKRLHIKQSWLWGSFVRSLKHKGYNVYAYTVNTRKRAQELEEWGVDGIVTDYPDKFLN